MARKKRTRANGDGSIYYDEAKDLYTARIKVGRNPETGKPFFVSRSARKRADAKQKMDDYLRDHPEHDPNADKTTLK